MRVADDVLGDTAVTFSHRPAPVLSTRFSREYPGPLAPSLPSPSE